MKTKFLSIIIGLFATSLAMTSCLSTTDPVSYEVDGTLKAFSFDSIRVDKTHFAVGRKHPFSIQQNGENATSLIYNTNPLPVNADLKKVKVNIATSGLVTYIKNGKDTIWNSTDTLDFTAPVNFTVLAYNSDGTIVKRVYKVSFSKHTQDPDSLNWGTNPYGVNTGVVGKHKSIIYNNNVYTFQDDNSAQVKVSSSDVSDGATWTALSPITGIEGKADYTSVTVFKNKLYILSSGFAYASTDGINWSKQDLLGGDIKNLLVSFDGKLSATKTVSGILKFCVTSDGTTWKLGKDVPRDFPTSNVSATSYSLKTNSNIKTAILVGDRENLLPGETDLIAVPWSTFDGLEWANLPYIPKDPTATDYSCPKTKNISIIYYNNKLYTFGGQGATSLDSFYSSEEGIVWKKVTEKVCFPNVFKGRDNYSFVLDSNNFIWMIWSKTGTSGADNVWKGRINSMNTQIQ